MTFGAFNSQGRLAITSTASAPPTPIAHMPRPSGIRSVRIRPDHKSTRKRVVLKNNLVDNPRTRSPETNVVFGTRGGQEIVHFLIDVLRTSQVLISPNLSLNEMVAMDRCWSRNRWHTSRHELQDCHLGGRVLASHSIWAELQVRLATFNVLSVRIIKMRV